VIRPGLSSLKKDSANQELSNDISFIHIESRIKKLNSIKPAAIQLAYTQIEVLINEKNLPQDFYF